MGRVFWAKRTVEESLVFSVYTLNKGLIFSWPTGKSYSMYWSNQWGEITYSSGYKATEEYSGIELDYTVTSSAEAEKVKLLVPLETTPCNYGGKRYWFICPLYTDGVYCGRRVAKLYLPPGAKYFGCRHCHDLSYNSRQTYRGPNYWALTRPLQYMTGQRKWPKCKTEKQRRRFEREVVRMRYFLDQVNHRMKKGKRRKK